MMIRDRYLVMVFFIILTNISQASNPPSVLAEERNACDIEKQEILEGNWAAEMHLPDHKGDDLILVWNDEGVVYTTGTEDPRVDHEGQPQLTYAQKFHLSDKFPDCNL